MKNNSTSVLYSYLSTGVSMSQQNIRYKQSDAEMTHL